MVAGIVVVVVIAEMVVGLVVVVVDEVLFTESAIRISSYSVSSLLVLSGVGSFAFSEIKELVFEKM